MIALALSYSEPPAGDRRYAVSVTPHGAALQNRKVLITRFTTGGLGTVARAGAKKASGSVAAKTRAIPRSRISHRLRSSSLRGFLPRPEKTRPFATLPGTTRGG